MGRNREGYAWLYWDCRRQRSDGYWFTILGNHEIDRAIKQLNSAAALKMYLYICKVSNGRTAISCPDGVAIGEAMIAEACGISRASMYRAQKELRKAGLLQVSKVGIETRALLVSPQKGEEKDLRRNPKNEKVEENSEKLQSQIRDCNFSQNCDSTQELCQNSQSHICDDDQYLQDLIIPPIVPPIELIEGGARDQKVLARSIDRETAPDQEPKHVEEIDEPGSLAKKGSPTFLREPTPAEIAMCSILTRADNLFVATEDPDAFIDRVTLKSGRNGQSLLETHGYRGSNRKRTIRSIFDTVLRDFLDEETKINNIKFLIENQVEPWTQSSQPAQLQNSDFAGGPQNRTVKPLADVFIDQYEKDLQFYLNDELLGHVEPGLLMRAMMEPDQEHPGLPHAFAQYMRLIGELDRLVADQTEYRPTNAQKARMRELMVKCGDLFFKLIDRG